MREFLCKNSKTKVGVSPARKASGEKMNNVEVEKVLEKSVAIKTSIEDTRAIVLQDESDGATDQRQVKEMSRQELYKDLTKNLNTGEPDDIISLNGFLELRRRDYRSLTGVNHLNDKIVDEYLHLIQERSTKVQDLPAVYAMPVHAYTWLDEDFERNFKTVESWIKEDLEEKDMIFIPINKAEHWRLVVFNVKEELLTYYDSILGTRKTSNALKTIKAFLTQYFSRKSKEIKITTKVEEKASLQTNSYDCGVFLCENAEILSRKKWAKPKQDDMPKIRRRMIKELIHGSLD